MREKTHKIASRFFDISEELGIPLRPFLRRMKRRKQCFPFVEEFTPEFRDLVLNYRDEENYHKMIWDTFFSKSNEIQYLKNHRNFVEDNQFGYGDPAFQYFWKLLVEQVPNEFKFLEIGVFKGQIISLVKLLSDRTKKRALIFGITPLSSAGDKYARHPDIDYTGAIQHIHEQFELSLNSTRIIQGYSDDPEIQKEILPSAPFDVVYIDGCHDYEIVANDIRIYGPMVRRGGFLVIDDCSRYLNMPDTVNDGGIIKYWKGLPDVCDAVRDHLDNDERFLHLLACGHLRTWMRLR